MRVFKIGTYTSLAAVGERWALTRLFGKKNSKFSSTPLINNQMSTSSKKKIPYTLEDNMKLVTQSINRVSNKIVRDLKNDGFAVIDNVLGFEVCSYYRTEAQGYYDRKEMLTSQSTFFDQTTNAIVSYDKLNVLSTQLNGGDDYEKAPRLHEYVVALTKTMVS